MNANAISAAELQRMLERMADSIIAAEPKLTALDSAIGDGDHGITMRRGFQQVQAAMASLPPDVSIENVWAVAGRAFMRSTGGAIGVILGRALCAAGTAMSGAAVMGPAEVRAAFAMMEKEVADIGKAQPGDKTILDALHAANAALESLPECDNLPALLEAAALGAERGAQSTAEMHCRVGRASKLGERAIGHPDPGATSFSILVRSMADELQTVACGTAGVCD